MSSTTVGEAKIALRLDNGKLSGDMKSVQKEVTSFSERVKSSIVGNLGADLLKGVTNAAKNAISEVAKIGTSFESSMAKVKAVSGATASDFEKLTAKAREMGKNTVFSASDAAEAMNYMAMAGWDTSDMLDGLEGIMDLAAASGTDLATTSDIVTDALTAMGYSAKDSGKFADVMAAASANANTNVQMMGESFKYAASVAGSLGYNIEDTSVALGLMANSGIKAEQAGTSLRSILSRLASPTTETKKAMDALGVSLTDERGNMRSLDDVMKDLRKGFSKLSATQKAEAAESIAGKSAMTGLLAIVNASETDYNKLTKAVNNSTGAAKKMADTMNNTVSGRLKMIKSKLEDVALTVMDKLSPSIVKALDKVQAALNKINWDAFAEKIGAVFGKLVDVFMWVVDHADLVIGALQAVIAAMAIQKVGEFAGAIIGVLGTINALLGPMGVILTITAAVGAAFIGFGEAMHEAGKTTVEESETVREYNRVLGESIEFMEQSHATLAELEKKRDETIQTGMREISYYESLADELDSLVDANGKVMDGYEERAQFITSTLSSALGIEIKNVDGVIEGYNKIREQILKTIEAKKAELVLKSQEELYQNALKQRVEISNRIRELEEQQQKIAEDTTLTEETRIQQIQELNFQMMNYKDDYEQYTVTISQYEHNMSLYAQENYSAMAEVIHAYSDEYTDAASARQAALDTEIFNLGLELETATNLYKQTGDDQYRLQKDSITRRLTAKEEEKSRYLTTAQEEADSVVAIKNEENQKIEAISQEQTTNVVAAKDNEKQQYLEKTKEQLAQAYVYFHDGLDDQLSEITGRNIQFRDAGDGLVKMMIDGLESERTMTTSEVASLVEAAIMEVTNAEPNALQAGLSLINGINDGLGDPSAQEDVLNSAHLFSDAVVRKIEDAWVVNSPSKVGEADGIYLIRGIGNGINNGGAQDGVFGAISSFANGIVARFKNALGIHSPSKIMQEIVGKNIAAGIGVGFEDEIGDVEKDMVKQVNGLASEVYSEVPKFDYATSTMADIMLKSAIDDDYNAKTRARELDEPKQPLIVNLMLDSRKIGQAMLQDIRRTR